MALREILAPEGPAGPLAILTIVVVSFVAGGLLDAVRDSLEDLWDKFQPIDWKTLFTQDKDKIESFRNSYFTYYVFDCNVSAALIVVLGLSFRVSHPWWGQLLLGVFVIIFLWNAYRLRAQIAGKP
jgi:hypothetical protein